MKTDWTRKKCWVQFPFKRRRDLLAEKKIKVACLYGEMSIRKVLTCRNERPLNFPFGAAIKDRIKNSIKFTNIPTAGAKSKYLLYIANRTRRVCHLTPPFYLRWIQSWKRKYFFGRRKSRYEICVELSPVEVHLFGAYGPRVTRPLMLLRDFWGCSAAHKLSALGKGVQRSRPVATKICVLKTFSINYHLRTLRRASRADTLSHLNDRDI